MKNDLDRLVKTAGFDCYGITSPNLEKHHTHFLEWLANGHHGNMNFLAKHQEKRLSPHMLFPETLSIISVGKYYARPFPTPGFSQHAQLEDYHQTMKTLLRTLAETLRKEYGSFNYRIFCDTSPVLEKPIAEQAGLGWIGKNTTLINKNLGSFLYLGEIFLDIELPHNTTAENLCGKCEKCLHACPTRALHKPYHLNANLCISYLTIEYRGIIPEALRPLIGTRIFGCDECQLACPFNKKVTNKKISIEKLLHYFEWDEKTFLENFKNSDVKRIGYECWLRNIAVALGNSEKSAVIMKALENRLSIASDLVKPHIQWALEQQGFRI